MTTHPHDVVSVCHFVVAKFLPLEKSVLCWCHSLCSAVCSHWEPHEETEASQFDYKSTSEDGSSKIHRNVGILPKHHTVSLESSPPRALQMSHQFVTIQFCDAQFHAQFFFWNSFL
jgi:hypothetical protein